MIIQALKPLFKECHQFSLSGTSNWNNEIFTSEIHSILETCVWCIVAKNPRPITNCRLWPSLSKIISEELLQYTKLQTCRLKSVSKKYAHKYTIDTVVWFIRSRKPWPIMKLIFMTQSISKRISENRRRGHYQLLLWWLFQIRENAYLACFYPENLRYQDTTWFGKHSLHSI